MRLSCTPSLQLEIICRHKESIRDRGRHPESRQKLGERIPV